MPVATRKDLRQQKCCKFFFCFRLLLTVQKGQLIRFRVSTYRPSTWAGEEISVDATQLPPDTEINSNGAGDSFTAGLLVAAMLRNTGICMQYASPTKDNNNMDDYDEVESASGGSPTKKATPYSLYMRENYVALKAQCSDDKKAIFEKCNEMWEEESDETKQMYERKAQEEIDSTQVVGNTQTLDVQSPPPVQSPKVSRNLKLANQPMNIETAAQFACLVAARHVDTSTRDCSHLNINTIREQSSVSVHGLEEI